MDYIFCGKYFFKRTDNGYRKLELYLPAASGTYGEDTEITKQRWLNDLNELDGSIRLKKPLAGKLIKHVSYSFEDRFKYDWDEAGKLTRIRTTNKTT